MITKKQKIQLTIVLLLGSVTFIGLTNLTQLVIKDYLLYQDESACVQQYIMKNYRRVDIATSNGTCWIKGVEQ